MNRWLARVRNGAGSGANWRRGGTHRRGDAMAGRLRAARETFDDSVVALRKAALDHVDCQDLASTALRANLDRLARRLGEEA